MDGKVFNYCLQILQNCTVCELKSPGKYLLHYDNLIFLEALQLSSHPPFSDMIGDKFFSRRLWEWCPKRTGRRPAPYPVARSPCRDMIIYIERVK